MQDYLRKRRNIQWNSSTSGRATAALLIVILSTLTSLGINPHCITGTSTMDSLVITSSCQSCAMSLSKTLLVQTGGWVLMLRDEFPSNLVGVLFLDSTGSNGVLTMDSWV